MIPTDVTPPPDRERRPRIGLTLVISIAVSIAGAGVTWGAFTQRITALEKVSDAVVPKVNEIDRAVVVMDARSDEIIRRLERIERKLDRQDRER